MFAPKLSWLVESPTPHRVCPPRDECLVAGNGAEQLIPVLSVSLADVWPERASVAHFFLAQSEDNWCEWMSFDILDDGRYRLRETATPLEPMDSRGGTRSCASSNRKASENDGST